MTSGNEITLQRPESSDGGTGLPPNRMQPARDVSAQQSERPAISRHERRREFPLSCAQKRLWFLDRLEPGIAVDNLCRAVRLTGSLQVPALERGLNEIIRRHEILRTNFFDHEGNPVQVIAEGRILKLPVLDLSDHPGDRREEELQRILEEEAQRPFNLSDDPLLRALLVRLEAAEHVLLVTLHHIVSDGRSLDIFLLEMEVLYESFQTGKPAPLPELPVQYGDFALWEQDWLESEPLRRQLAHWKRKLIGVLPTLELPTDRPRPAVQSLRGGSETLQLSQTLIQALKNLGTAENASLFMTLLTAFLALLHRYTGQEDILVGSLVAGRNHPKLETLIGCFGNRLVFRGNSAGNPTFRKLLQRTRDMALEAFAHCGLPFEKLVEELQPERTLSRNPFFQVIFESQNAPMPTMQWAELKVQPIEVNTGLARFDLNLILTETPPGMRATLKYNADLFRRSTMSRLLGHFQTILEGAAADPDQNLSELPLLTPSERRQLLNEWNETAVAYPREACIHELFQAQAERTPSATALVWGEDRVTYQELDGRANQLADRLRKLGVGPETLVGVCIGRTPAMVVGLLAILKAGGAYVPLDPAYPRERLAFILRDARAPVLLLTQDSPRADLQFELPGLKVVSLAAAGPEPCDAEAASSPPRSGVAASNLAYVIYTSGSTGRPKGVAIQHRSAVAFIHWAQHTFTRDELCGVLASTSICFDLSVFELFVPLSCGGTVILSDNALEYVGLPARREVTLLNTVPSAIAELLTLRAVSESVRTINLAGEPLSARLVQQLYGLGTVQKVHDLYGPTEDTTYSTFALRKPDRPATIGRPIANTQVYIVDSRLQPVPVGVPGELCLGGDGLARGYLNRPALTAEKFVPNPFGIGCGGRLYRTGDLARYLPDGNIEFLGRMDRQVKIRGFRVELTGVQSVLSQHPAVKDVIVIAREHQPGEKQLVAYLVAAREPAPSPVELRQYLQQKLPNYMIPSVFVTLDKLPLTPNGKVDWHALPDPGTTRETTETDFIAPRDALEIQLAAIWENVLNIRPVGVHDDFFELGGHSLLAVRLFTQIEKRLGPKLPLSVLFQGPTLEQLAQIISTESWSAPGASLVKIQPHGSRAPMFWLHTLGGGGGGGLFAYRKVAELLGPDQPSYGLVTPPEPFARIEDMAAHYIREIRTLQPDGPYHLGGYCFGGVVAFEMARQLEEQGIRVGLLAAIELPPPRGYKRRGVDSQLIGHFLRTLPAWTKYLFAQGRKETGARIRQKTRNLLRKIKRRVWGSPDRGAVAEIQARLEEIIDFAHYPEDFKRYARTHWEALERYCPKAYPGRIALFRTHRPHLFELEPEMYWRNLAGAVDVSLIPGTHEQVLDEPHVQTLAGRLSACLEKAQLRTER